MRKYWLFLFIIPISFFLLTYCQKEKPMMPHEKATATKEKPIQELSLLLGLPI